MCDKVVLCGTGGRREDEEEEKDRDTESKTRTPQKKTWGNRSNKIISVVQEPNREPRNEPKT